MISLKPGQTSGELMNEHPKPEQWVFVVFGAGQAIESVEGLVVLALPTVMATLITCCQKIR